MNYKNYSLLFIIFLIIPHLLLSQDEFFEPKSTIGGYGELHYNYVKPEEGDASRMLDFHRFIIFYSHSWTEKWRFKSEVELEHNFVKSGQGELELEQAYVEYFHSPAFIFQIGVVLPSAGLINETHEPPTFLSVERPRYAQVIIPTTWFGNGAAITGQFNDLDYKVTVMEGLNADKFSASSGIRGGRIKGYKANAEEFLYNARLDYIGLPGLRAGFSASRTNAMVEVGDNIPVTLLEAHARYNKSNFIATFEIGNISYGEGSLEASRGYYFELGYNIAQQLGVSGKLIPWFRWSDINTAASTTTGGISEEIHHNKNFLLGITCMPIEKVAFKFDFGKQTNEFTDASSTLINFGVGYMF